MRLKLTHVALFAAALLLTQCGGDHSSPTEPSGPPMGILRFLDSGCTCGHSPHPPITVYVDGQVYSFKVFGGIDIPLTPGPHTWALTLSDRPFVVQIEAGRTHTEHLVTNDGCADGCDSGDSATVKSRSPRASAVGKPGFSLFFRPASAGDREEQAG